MLLESTMSRHQAKNSRTECSVAEVSMEKGFAKAVNAINISTIYVGNLSTKSFEKSKHVGDPNVFRTNSFASGIITTL